MLGSCWIRRPYLQIACLLTLGLAAINVQAQEQTPAVLWDDFNHYVLIARPDLAVATGEKLLQQADAATLLDVVEASDFPDYLKALDRAAGVQEVQPVADKLLNELRQAAIERSRDKQRIAADIKQLAEGRRPAAEATRRLQAAGQYAAPQLLEVLEDGRQEALHPYVARAMIAVGPEMVYPLSSALPELEPVTMSRVAQILAELGYPQAIPALKQVQGMKDLDVTTRRAIDTALAKLLAEQTISTDLPAAQQYLTRGVGEYDQGTRGAMPLGSDEKTDTGVLWVYAERLIPVNVPLPIYADVLAMDSAKKALALDNTLDPALSLYLMANFRRENSLPEDGVDPSYPGDMNSPMFYAMLSGPERLHDVLAKALSDQDADLALDALQALSQTSGTAALLKQNAGRQPMIDALAYPDRRVRFEGAIALANARPQQLYPGAFRVVTVLSEAVSAGGTPMALIITNDVSRRNMLNRMLTDMGYGVIQGANLNAVSDEIAAKPGIDLIVTDESLAATRGVISDTSIDYRLASSPVLAIVSQNDYPQMVEMVSNDGRVFAMVRSDDATSTQGEIEKVLQTYGGADMEQEEATAYALGSLDQLIDIAKGASIYQPDDAQASLIAALTDPRPQVVAKAAEVLALLESATAQQALADASMKLTGDLQIAILNSLADSATNYGNLLKPEQSEALSKLVGESRGALGEAASRAHGALSLPTSQAVLLIESDSSR